MFTWFLAWPPYALSHGLNPFFSTALNHPTGVNLLANTSELAIGVLLAPVTWLFGVIAALNLALILSPVLSALAMFFLLRRWVAWSPAAFIGGLAYGFSPFVLGSLNDAHLMLGMAAVPPLVVAGLDEMLVRQLRPPVLIGILLGLLVVVQFFVGTEVLLITTIMATVSVVLVVLYAAIEHPEVLRRRSRHVAVGLSAGAVTAGALLAYPAWFALAGPAHPSGPIWPGMNLATGYGASTLKGFFVPSRLLTWQFDALDGFGAFATPPLSWQYFGIGIPVILGTGLIVRRRDRRLWLFAMVALISASLSLGVSKSLVLPWQLLADLPQMENVTPLRFVLITYLAAAVMLGIIVDHTYVAVTRRREAVRDGSPQPPSQVRLPRSARWAGAAVGMIVAGIALLPVAWFLAPSVPVAAQPVVLPTWFRTVAPHLQGRQVLLVVPAAFSQLESSMTWQAVDRMPFSMVGIGGPGDYGSRAGEERDGEAVITAISNLANVQLAQPGSILVVRQALEDWGVTLVVMPDQGHLPAYDRLPR